MLYPKDFIKITFLEQYREIVYAHKFHYISFALICIGIEFLGKCLDQPNGWHDKGRSKEHFENAINELMPKYSACSSKLYKQLRSGFAHGLLPGTDIGLTHRDESVQYGTHNLGEHNGNLILVVEEFYDDFELACREILNRQFPQGDKMTKAILAMPSDPIA
ncbi:MAG: hypothetical protein ABR912_03235 [Terracidiphilus sp.]|jgi:hypothetical protein